MIQRKQFLEEMQMQSSDAHFLESAREVKKYDAVIVGAGLAGLTTAVEASRAGKAVLVIESRQERYAAIRPQIIYLHSTTLDYLISLNEGKANLDSADANLLNRLDEVGHFSIKDIQRYLLRCIDRRYCTIRYESVVAEINLDEGSLKAVNVNDPLQQEEIKFDNLILADGVKHPTARLLKSHIEYQSVAERPEKKHIMGYFTVTSKDGTSIENPIGHLLAPVVHNNRCGLIYHEREVKGIGEQNKLKVYIVMHDTE
jgi:2-polyprenyl-6-methoxyphenol hydroxylase-like FAD-dependent oxidoreductase